MANNFEAKNSTEKSMGPIELVIIAFPENHFRGEIVRELKKLVENDIIRIVDILFVKKGEKDSVTVIEMAELEDEDSMAFSFMKGDIKGLLSEKDAKEFTRKAKENSSIAMMLFENKWAQDFVQAVDRAKGNVVLNERIPRDVVRGMVASLKAKA